MPLLISPKQVAQAIGVSESSLKRWCDQGIIESVRTAGGHRRISSASVVQFLQKTGHRLAQPELLKLPATTTRRSHNLEDARQRMCRALLVGDKEACRLILCELHLAARPAYAICDQVLAGAFADIGQLWSCGDAQVYQERRACELCVSLLDELRSMTAEPQSHLLAIGGTPECDPYVLPSTMVELVLRQAGWRAQSLGSRLPWDTMVAAIDREKPILFWISVSHLEDVARFVAEYRKFYEQVRASTAVVVGGRALTEEVRRQMEFAAHCDTLQHLDAFVQCWPQRVARGPSSTAGHGTRRQAKERIR